MEKAEGCFVTSCTRKEELRALNVTRKACTDGPARDKSKSYREVNLSLYIISVIAVFAQYTVRYAVGRLHWLDDGNMAMVLAMNTLLFGVCYKMSWTGLGLDMWNVAPTDITTTLLVSSELLVRNRSLKSPAVLLDKRDRVLQHPWLH